MKSLEKKRKKRVCFPFTNSTFFPFYLEETKDFCEAVCGKKDGVKCTGDKTKENAITCVCEDDKKIFDKVAKECKGKENTVSANKIK